MSSNKTLVLDSSVIVAILTREPDAETYEELVNSAQRLLVGAPTLVETSMVLISRLGPENGMIAIFKFLTRTRCEVIDFTRLHFVEAATAFQQFGKGRHPAGLNLFPPIPLTARAAASQCGVCTASGYFFKS